MGERDGERDGGRKMSDMSDSHVLEAVLSSDCIRVNSIGWIKLALLADGLELSAIAAVLERVGNV